MENIFIDITSLPVVRWLRKDEESEGFESYWMFGITNDSDFQGYRCLGGHDSRRQKEAG